MNLRIRLRTVVLVSLGILIVGLAIGSVGTCSMRRQRDAWKLVAAERDTLHKDADGKYHRAMAELENVRQMRATYRDSFPDLYEENRRLKAREQVLVQAIARMESDTTAVSATDTVYVEEGVRVSRVDFQLEYEGATVTGHTTTPPPRAEARIDYRPIPLTILVSQLRDKSWRTNVETAPWVEILSLDARVVPYRSSWLERHDFEIGIGIGVVATLFLASLLIG